jgi:hypothetical protein
LRLRAEFDDSVWRTPTLIAELDWQPDSSNENKQQRPTQNKPLRGSAVGAACGA